MSLALIGIIVLQLNWIVWSLRLNEEQFDKNAFAALNRVADRLQAMENDQALNYINGYETSYMEQVIQGLIDDTAKVTDINLISNSLAEKNEFALPDDQFSQLLYAENNCSCSKCQAERFLNYNRLVKNNRFRNSYPLADRIDLPTLNRILKEEMSNVGININYNYSVYETSRKSMIITDNHYVVAANSDNLFQAGGEDHLKNSKYRVQLFGLGNKAPGMLLVYFPKIANAIWGSIWYTVIASFLFTLIILGGFIYTIYVIFRQKQLSEMKNDFINNMTHEFKTPIATISLAADSITSPIVTSDVTKVRRFADIIKQENRRMHGQVEKVLQMAMIEKHDLNLNLSSVDLHEVIQQAVLNIALQVEQKEGEITTQLKAVNPVIEGDPTHISNIVHNLLDNANKYTPDHPIITVSTRNTEEGVELVVSDNGIGISKEARKHIFDKFYRVHTGNLHDVKGFGLGLSYVKAMMQAHHGQIDVYSEPGKGSSFILVFPFKQI